MTTADLPQLVREFLLERTTLLMRHEDVARQVTDYDVNNTYQNVINREETHVSWLQHALVDLGEPIPADPPRPAVATSTGAGAWKALAADDARASAQFVEAWRPRVESITNARHKEMLKVVLGEMLEHMRFFNQGAAGRTDLLGTSLAINDHRGTVLSARWVE